MTPPIPENAGEREEIARKLALFSKDELIEELIGALERVAFLARNHAARAPMQEAEEQIDVLAALQITENADIDFLLAQLNLNLDSVAARTAVGSFRKQMILCAVTRPWPNPPAARSLDGETIQTLLDLLNPLHGELDKQTYDAKISMEFDTPPDYAHDVCVTAQQERDLCQAVLILENRRTAVTRPDGGQPKSSG
jgi:hypothetical protein